MNVSLSNMEWKLMNQLWSEAPMTLMQLTRALEADTGWTKHTVITMLTRLESKGAVRWEQAGRAREYYPVIAAEDARRGDGGGWWRTPAAPAHSSTGTTDGGGRTPRPHSTVGG